MTQQFLDHKSSGFNKLVETIEAVSITIKSNHSNININHKMRFIIINNEALSNCGKLRIKIDDIQTTVARKCPQKTRFLHLFFMDRSSIHMELECDSNEQLDFILKAIETDDKTIPDCNTSLPLCDCCKKYEADINKTPESHPISVIIRNCHSRKLPVKVEFGFGAISYSHEGSVSNLNFNEGCVEFSSHSSNKLNLSRIHSLMLNQEEVENSHYTTLSTYSSHGEKIYTLSVHHSGAYSQWERTLTEMCVRK